MIIVDLNYLEDASEADVVVGGTKGCTKWYCPSAPEPSAPGPIIGIGGNGGAGGAGGNGGNGGNGGDGAPGIVFQ